MQKTISRTLPLLCLILMAGVSCKNQKSAATASAKTEQPEKPELPKMAEYPNPHTENASKEVMLVEFDPDVKNLPTTISVAVNGVEIENSTKYGRVSVIPNKPGDFGTHVTVKSATIIGHDLLLTVEYSGGCNTHDFMLYSNGMAARTRPAQMNVVLAHRGNGDACEQLIQEQLKFSIEPLIAIQVPPFMLMVQDLKEPLRIEG